MSVQDGPVLRQDVPAESTFEPVRLSEFSRIRQPSMGRCAAGSKRVQQSSMGRSTTGCHLPESAIGSTRVRKDSDRKASVIDSLSSMWRSYGVADPKDHRGQDCVVEDSHVSRPEVSWRNTFHSWWRIPAMYQRLQAREPYRFLNSSVFGTNREPPSKHSGKSQLGTSFKLGRRVHSPQCRLHVHGESESGLGSPQRAGASRTTTTPASTTATVESYSNSNEEPISSKPRWTSKSVCSNRIPGSELHNAPHARTGHRLRSGCIASPHGRDQQASSSSDPHGRLSELSGRYGCSHGKHERYSGDEGSTLSKCEVQDSNQVSRTPRSSPRVEHRSRSSYYA